MSPSPEPSTRRVIRVFTPGLPGFQLRQGEDGISVFHPDAVVPPLSEEEVLECFRPGSRSIVRAVDELTLRGLQVVAVEGADVLPDRLRQSHCEIRPGPAMSRADFKRALKEVE